MSTPKALRPLKSLKPCNKRPDRECDRLLPMCESCVRRYLFQDRFVARLILRLKKKKRIDLSPFFCHELKSPFEFPFETLIQFFFFFYIFRYYFEIKRNSMFDRFLRSRQRLILKISRSLLNNTLQFRFLIKKK